MADLFYKSYYLKLFNEVFCVLTDSFHKSGFKLQVEILFHLIEVVEMGMISENLFDSNNSNKNYVMNFILNLLKNAYSNLNSIQIETFCIALFNKCYNFHEFKYLIRDFLVMLKSFSGNNEEFFEEEKKVKIIFLLNLRLINIFFIILNINIILLLFILNFYRLN